MMSRASASGPPPFWLWKLARASGNAASDGESARSNSVLVTLRSFLRTMFTRPVPTLHALEHALDVRVLGHDRRDLVGRRFGLLRACCPAAG